MKPTLLLLLMVALVSCIPRERSGGGFARDSLVPLPVVHQGHQHTKRGLLSDCFGKRCKQKNTKNEELPKYATVWNQNPIYKSPITTYTNPTYEPSIYSTHHYPPVKPRGHHPKRGKYGRTKRSTDLHAEIRKNPLFLKGQQQPNAHPGRTIRKRSFFDKLKSKFSRKSKKRNKPRNSEQQRRANRRERIRYNKPKRDDADDQDNSDDDGNNDDYDGDEVSRYDNADDYDDDDHDHDDDDDNDNDDDDRTHRRGRRNRFGRGEAFERTLRSLMVLSSHLTLDATQNETKPSADTMIKEVDDSKQAKTDERSPVGQEDENEALGGKKDAQMEQLMQHGVEEDENTEDNHETYSMDEDDDDDDDDDDNNDDDNDDDDNDDDNDGDDDDNEDDDNDDDDDDDDNNDDDDDDDTDNDDDGGDYDDDEEEEQEVEVDATI